jgi:hypothetical protein
MPVLDICGSPRGCEAAGRFVLRLAMAAGKACKDSGAGLGVVGGRAGGGRCRRSGRVLSTQLASFEMGMLDPDRASSLGVFVVLRREMSGALVAARQLADHSISARVYRERERQAPVCRSSRSGRRARRAYRAGTASSRAAVAARGLLLFRSRDWPRPALRGTRRARIIFRLWTRAVRVLAERVYADRAGVEARACVAVVRFCLLGAGGCARRGTDEQPDRAVISTIGTRCGRSVERDVRQRRRI